MSKDYAHVLSTYAVVFDIHPLSPKRDLVNNHIIFFNLQYFFYLPTLSDQRQKSHSHKSSQTTTKKFQISRIYSTIPVVDTTRHLGSTDNDHTP